MDVCEPKSMHCGRILNMTACCGAESYPLLRHTVWHPCYMCVLGKPEAFISHRYWTSWQSIILESLLPMEVMIRSRTYAASASFMSNASSAKHTKHAVYRPSRSPELDKADNHPQYRCEYLRLQLSSYVFSLPSRRTSTW